ncbi:MAG TPA: PIN domain-containing protein [Desulfomonilia bacterium]
MKETVIPDTNVILRYLIKDAPEHYIEADVFFDKVYEGRVNAVILECVIAECAYVLGKLYKIPRAEISEHLIELLNYRGISNADKNDLILALKLYSLNTLDIADCIAAAKASGMNAKLFSFDKDLNKAFNKLVKNQ